MLRISELVEVQELKIMNFELKKRSAFNCRLAGGAKIAHSA
jgi:hypothetical protein